MQKIETALTEMLGIRYPIIMAPMFLVSNAAMTIEALNAGITGTIPALNYRTDKDFREALKQIRANAKGPIGINLIANKSNIKLEEQLRTCVEMHVDYIITSLGSPEKIINACKPEGIKVFCDVVDDKFARKVEDMGADAIIAVNSGAGGHAGPLPAEVLVPMLLDACSIPVISAGGVGKGDQLIPILEMGACGVSIGSPFIATYEAPVSQEYKQAIIDYGAKDIVMTTKISGTPCTVINTPYVQQIGTRQNWLEAVLSKNKSLKKYVKLLTFYKGMKAIEKAAFSATYKTVWCAGPSIEYVTEIRPVKQVVESLIKEYEVASKREVTV
ncbi:MAG: nitronate monooxygenase [Chitinophagales bacterium]|nr:nitronate monooxygenase [Chitinophagales bacterium]